MIDFILHYTYIITIVLFLVKSALFIHYKNEKWRLLQFIYFDARTTRLSVNKKRSALKKVQNFLSIAITALLILNLSVVLLINN
ncbi:MAG TPA: hypothetical protein VF623_12345 [Segetibacter sp.]